MLLFMVFFFTSALLVLGHHCSGGGSPIVGHHPFEGGFAHVQVPLGRGQPAPVQPLPG